MPSYDGRNKEPVTLPSKLPLLLMLGAEGIAVGLSTRVFPHNFTELIEAQVAILKKQPFTLTPDFPQGGLMDASEYDKGNGRLRVRAVIESAGEDTLRITELPFGVSSETLISSIEEASRKKKVPIKSITDFTADKVEIELTLTPNTSPGTAIKSLYAFTACESVMSGRTVVIRGNRPADMNVDDVLRANTEQLLRTLKRELALKQHDLREEIHAKTLVQIFIENRIYKRIEECRTAQAVTQAVFDGLAPFRPKLSRDVTKADVEMLLAVRIRRISLFDINKNREDIERIVRELAEVEKQLKQLRQYAVRYLNGLIRKYGEQYPRRTRITSFDEVEVKELTAQELQICLDKATGYLGYSVKGDPVLECSSYDKLALVWEDAGYKVVQPPEKVFVDKTLLYCGKADRDRVMTIIYTLDRITYMKRFTFGGTILNKEYRCAPKGAVVRLFSDETVEEVYVKYAPHKGQRIHQQVFRPSEAPVKGVKAMGNMMAMKKIARLSVKKPRWWEDGHESPRGRLM